MKRLFIILLTLATILSATAIPVSAATTGADDFRYLEAYGQHHYYLGEALKSKPVCDGVISSGEYSASKSFTPESYATGRASAGIQYFGYDAENIYMAVEITEEKFTYGTNLFNFNIAMPSYGSFTDAASRAGISIKMTSSTAVTISGLSYLDHANGTPLSASLTRELVSAYGASRVGSKSIYEVAVSREEFSKQIGFSGDTVAFFSYNSSYDNEVQWYRFSLTTALSNSLKAAHPQHELKMAWVPHIVHLDSQHDDNTNITTVDKAAVRIEDDGNNGLRFKTYISKKTVDSYLNNNYNRNNTKFVTLITPLENLNKANGVFTKEALEAACPDLPYIEVRGYLEAPYDTDGDCNVYAGSIVNVHNVYRDFAAIGYIEHNGEIVYSSTHCVRSLASVAVAALRDVSSVGVIDEYKYPITWGTGTADTVMTVHSPYDAKQTEILYKFAGNMAQTLRYELSDIIAKDEGDIRIVSSNIYFHVFKNKTDAEKAAVVQRMVTALSSTNADVFLLQEASAGTIKGLDFDWQGRLHPELTSMGFTKVNVTVDTLPSSCISKGNPVGVNYTPIYYNANKLTLIDAKHKFYSSIAQNPDSYLSSSKSYTWALFEDKATGERFITITTHLTYHGDATTANKLRTQDATELMQEVSRLESTYNGVPIIVTGDFNCAPNSDPYSVIVSSNLCNSKNVAKSVYNGAFRTGNSIGPIPAIGNAIDHAFVSKSGLNVTKYQSLITEATVAATDHIPMAVDIRFE